MTLEEADEPVEVWPASVPAVNVFLALSTQWRMGFNGFIGLDYGVVPAVMRLCGVPHADRREMFEDLRVMEDAAMLVMAEERRSSREQ